MKSVMIYVMRPVFISMQIARPINADLFFSQSRLSTPVRLLGYVLFLLPD